MNGEPQMDSGRVLETDRLILRQLRAEDAAFILELVNEPGWLRNIGDRGVKNLEDARRYIEKGPVASYQKHGFGLLLVALKEGELPVGMCGLLKRDSLEYVDIGFALLARHESKGYAHESAAAVMHYGWSVVGLERIVAITAPENPGSIRLLGKLGFRFEGMLALPGYEDESRYFICDRPQTMDSKANQ